MKKRIMGEKISTILTALAILFVSVFSGMVIVHGAAQPQSPYALVQGFEGMTTDAQVTDFYNNLQIEPGCTGGLSLSTNGGYNGSKAVKVNYNLNTGSSWIRIDSSADNFTASGDGFSFWIKLDTPMRCRILVVDEWIQHTNDLITLEAGEHFVQVPWNDCEGTAEWDPNLHSVIAPNNPTNNLRVGILLNPVNSSGSTGTAYIDELGYIDPNAPTNPPDEPDNYYELFQNFDAMTSQAQLNSFFPYAEIDGDSRLTKSLSQNGGYQGSKAAKFDYNKIAWWLNFGDQALETNRYHAKGDGFSFWINTSRGIRIRLDVYDGWQEYEGETITLSPGEQFVKIPWTSVKRKNNPSISITPNDPNNSIMRVRIAVFNDGTNGAGTFYIDEVGYYTKPYEVFQNFNSMTSQAQLEGFYPHIAIDEDSQLTMSLSQNGGCDGSKAAKFEYNQIVSWLNFGDSALETNRYHSKGNGFCFWINTSREIRIRLDVFDDWQEYESEILTLSTGEQFVQIPWTSVKRKNNPSISITPNDPNNSLMRVRIAVFNQGGYQAGNFYIDEVGYYTKSFGKFEASLLQYHPGLAEYDAEYDIVVKNSGVPMSSGFTLSANDYRVTIQDGKVVVPYSVRNESKDVVITARSTGGQSSTVIIPSKKWDITFDDNFNGSDLDSNKWSVFEPELTYGDAPSYCARDCYEVSGGTLKLLAEKRETVLNGVTYQYTDGAISTQNKFTQSLGCYVSAMRYEPWSGICGGFWLLPEFNGQRQNLFFDGPSSDLGCGEIDIIEWSDFFGNQYSVTEHFWNYNNGQYSRSNNFMASPAAGKMYDGQFHAIGAVLTEDASYYYCDEELVGAFEHSYTTTNPSGGIMNPVNNFILFSYRMGPDDDSNWVGRWNFTDSDFPLKYEVDWCRAYE